VIVALAALLFFAWLAVEVSRSNTMGFDLAIRGAVHVWASPYLTYAMRGASLIGQSWFLIPLGLVLAVLLVRRGRRRAAVALAAAPIGAEFLVQILKAIFHRTRPEAFFGLPQPENYSFPSGHAMTSVCFYGAVAAILATGSNRKAACWIFGIGTPLLIGFSRVYLGVHYATDVLAGWAAGIVWLTAVLRQKDVAYALLRFLPMREWVSVSADAAPRRPSPQTPQDKKSSAEPDRE
jgi:undecaprenyl-diphosphatase